MRCRVAVDLERCKGCGLCVEVCPAGVLRMTGGLNARGWQVVEVVNVEACTGCCRCAEICPDAAITVERMGRDG